MLFSDILFTLRKKLRAKKIPGLSGILVCAGNYSIMRISLLCKFPESLFDLLFGSDTFIDDYHESKVRRLSLLQVKLQGNDGILLVLTLSLKVALAERVGREEAVASDMPVSGVINAFRVIENSYTDDFVFSYTLQGNPSGPFTPDIPGCLVSV
jgi:hypothetical protein